MGSQSKRNYQQDADYQESKTVYWAIQAGGSKQTHSLWIETTLDQNRLLILPTQEPATFLDPGF